MKRAFCSVLLIAYISAYCQSSYSIDPQHIPIGIPFIKNFETNDVYSNSKYTGIAQDNRGVIYFSSELGLVEFDGKNWKNIKINGNLNVTAIATDRYGKIFVGAMGDFGYLMPDQKGRLVFKSLKSFLPKNKFQFKIIESIQIADNEVIFQSNTHLFVYKKNVLNVFSTVNAYDQAFEAGQQIYVREWAKGLLKLSNNRFELVSQNRFAYDKIIALLPFQKGKLLALSVNKGIQVISSSPGDLLKENSSQIFDQINPFLLSNSPSCALLLSPELIAIGTSNGIFIIDTRGHIRQVINQSMGLKNNSINDLYLDKHQNLWVATDEGVSMVEINSPFTRLDEKLGLKGSVINSVLHQDKLYVGTSQGIFYLPWKGKYNSEDSLLIFKMVKNTKGNANQAFVFNNELIYSHTNGVLSVHDTVAKSLFSNVPALSFLIPDLKKGYLLLGKMSGGLSVLEKKGDAWLYRYDIQGLKDFCHTMSKDNQGNIWISDYNKGIIRVKFDEKYKKVVEMKLYDKKSGIPEFSRNSIISLNKEVVIVTSKGFFVYNPQTDRFEPHRSLNKILPKETYAFPLVQDKKGNIWFLQFGSVWFAPVRQKDKISASQHNLAFKKLKLDVLSHITPIDEENILFGTKKGLFLFNPEIQKDYHSPFHSLIREVMVAGPAQKDSLIFEGAFYGKNGFYSKDQNRRYFVAVPYKYNSIKFSYAASWYEDPEMTVYSFLLEGYDKEWSEWSEKSEKGYTNLPEGSYMFKVKARNIYGVESTVANYRFIVLPPWYRTYWAYVLYFSLGLMLMFGWVRFNTLRLRRKNILLAKEIDKATLQIKQTNQELENKNFALEQSYQNVRLMSEIGKDVTANLTVKKIIDTVYSNINRLMDASIFAVGVYNDERKAIHFTSVKEYNQTLPDFDIPLTEEMRLAVWCFNHQKEVFINELDKEYIHYVPKLVGPISGSTSHSIMYVPLVYKGKSIGVLSVQSEKPNVYSHYHLNIIQNLAVHVAIALENAKAYERLEELNREKNHLIGIVAHDLRNPLHHIQGIANVIQLNSENLNKKQQDYVSKIITTTEHLNQLIQNILDMNVIDSKITQMHLMETNLIEILNLVVDNLSDEARKKNIQIQYFHHIRRCNIIADKSFAIQVFENLLSNAVKFSEFNQSVVVKTERQNGKIITSVQDNGPGLTAEDFEKIFGKYQKLSAKPTAGEKSTGLGLSIVKKYVEAMNGKVWCESEPGKGATFYVEFEVVK